MKLKNILIYLVMIALAVAVTSCGDTSPDPILELPERIVSPNADTAYSSETPELTDTVAENSDTSVNETSEAETSVPETVFQEEIRVPEFNTDLSAYEKYMDPGNTTEYLTVVSREHTLPSTHVPSDRINLVDTRKDGRNTQQMREYAAKAMEAMFIEMRAAGYTDVSVTSAYRSYAYQESIFNMYLQQNNNDYEYVSTFSNPPGSSEHQTGLCADLHNLSSADVSFANKPVYSWLYDNCWKFGYILRYPEDKVDVTDISFEPWHYRYVGKEVAQYLYENDLCLEEYWLQLADMDPETYGYILEEVTPEQIVPKQEPQAQPQPVEPPVEETPQDTVVLDDSFTQAQQDAAAGNVSENTDQTNTDQTVIVEQPTENTTDETINVTEIDET